jgi:hypothetical protein
MRGRGVFDSERKQMKGFCEYDNETLGFMKDGEIVSS